MIYDSDLQHANISAGWRRINRTIQTFNRVYANAISTLVRRSILIFLRYLFPCELSITFCEFDTVAFLIINTVVIHRMLMFIS